MINKYVFYKAKSILFFLLISILNIKSFVGAIDINYPMQRGSAAPIYSKNNRKVVLVTIPKSGTHLILKCLTLFKIKGLGTCFDKEIFPTKQRLNEIRKTNENQPPHHFKGMYYNYLKDSLPPRLSKNLVKNSALHRLLWTHWPHTLKFERMVDQYSYANFFSIRDPRDMIVSFAYMVHENREKTKSVSVEDVIFDLITGEQKYYMPWAVEIHEGYPLLWEIGLEKFYRIYMPWLKAKNFMVIRFEDLIGEKGGGSEAVQLKTIMKIGQHLKCPMTVNKAQEIIKELFGGTWTFREGQIGSWKKHFTPKIMQAFKSRKGLMELLVDLGYEQDFNW